MAEHHMEDVEHQKGNNLEFSGTMSETAPSASHESVVDLGCMPVTRLSLRAAEFVLTLICFSVVAAAQGPSGGLALASRPFAFLLSMGVLGWVYSIGTIVLLTLALLRPDWELSYRLPRPLLFADFAFLLLLFAASSAAAALSNSMCVSTSVYGVYYGPSAEMWSACSMVMAGSAMGFLASFCFMADFWLTLIPVFAEI